MLSEATKELLTGFVDDALTRRERKAVLRLLNRSSEARAFLQELHENAHRLKQLPRKTLPADFSSWVMQAIETQKQKPVTPLPRPVPTRRGAPRWVGVFVAAAIMLAVGSTMIALVGPLLTPETPQGPVAKAPGVSIPPLPRTQPEPEKKPLLDSGSAITAKELAVKSPDIVGELKKNDEGVQLSVVARNDANPFEHLEQAFANTGIKLVIDPDAQVRINKGQPVLVYVENVQPVELQSILHKLGAGDKQPTFSSIQVGRFSAKEKDQVVSALNISKRDFDTPPELFRQTMIPAPSPGSKNKPPREVKAPEVRAERLAVAVGEKAARSREVDRIVHNREAQQPGALRLLVVVHPE